MTTTRRYSCNLCHDEITHYSMQEGAMDGNVSILAGVGMYFMSGSQEWAKFVHPRDAEHHVCDRCIKAIQTIKL